MGSDQMKQSFAAYLHLQANRCQKLSRSSMDLGCARDLRLMAEEYSGVASSMQAEIAAKDSPSCALATNVPPLAEPSFWREG
jgi:hypothetical protein